MRDLIGVQWSDTGTNLRDSEEDTVYAWEKFLLAVEGMTLSDAHSLHNMIKNAGSHAVVIAMYFQMLNCMLSVL